MIRKRFVTALALAATAGCAVTPATPEAVAPGRAVMAAKPAQIKIPTLEEMRKLIPAKLSREEGRKLLMTVPHDKVILPSQKRKTQFLHGLGFGALGWGGFGGLTSWQYGILGSPLNAIAGFYPFGYAGLDYYAPFLWSPLALAYTPFALSPWITSAYSYFASPFIGAYGWGLGTLGYTGLGCGLAPASLIATTAIGGCF